MEAAAGAPRLTGSVLPSGVTGPQLVRQVLDRAAEAGLTVVRAWCAPPLVDCAQGWLAGWPLPVGSTGRRALTCSPHRLSPSCCAPERRAHGVSPSYPSLLGPGQYNEGLLRGLDYFLAEAGKRGIKVGSAPALLVPWPPSAACTPPPVSGRQGRLGLPCPCYAPCPGHPVLHFQLVAGGRGGRLRQPHG